MFAIMQYITMDLIFDTKKAPSVFVICRRVSAPLYKITQQDDLRPGILYKISFPIFGSAVIKFLLISAIASQGLSQGPVHTSL